MKVLIVDADAAARAFLRRLIATRFACTLLEAEDGVQALGMIESEWPDLVFLEIDLPHLTGVEVLQAIRDSSEHQALTVVVVSGVDDPSVVEHLVKLGIADYLLKPLAVDLALSRIRMVLGGIGHTGQRRELGAESSTKDTLLLVDSDLNFRAFARPLLERRFEVHEAESGPSGMKEFMAVEPHLVCIGEGLELLNERMLAKTMRSWWRQAAGAAWREDPLICLVSPTDAPEPADLAHFDIFLKKTFVPETFLSDFNRVVMGEDTVSSHVRNIIRHDIRSELITATKQTVGVLTGQEVIVGDATGIPREVLAKSELSNEESDVIVAVGMVMARTDVVGITAGMFAGAPADEQNAADACGEVLNNIAGRIQASLAQRGHHLLQGTPTVQTIVGSEQTDDDWECAVAFCAEEGQKFVVFVAVCQP